MQGNDNRTWLLKAGTAAVLLFGFLLVSYSESSAQGLDFFSNTQTTDSRSDGTNANPGFNPCGAGGVAIATGCSTAGAGALLSTATIDLFKTLGPGAVTDNMFGLVSGAALGADGAVGGTGNNADTSVIQCAPGLGTGGSDPNGLRGLNCGDVRINPAQQGQTIPTDGTNLTGAMIANNSSDMNSGAGEALHRSQLENAFIWNPTTSAIALPVTLANMPTIGGVAPTADSCAAGSAANPRVCGQQSMQETTGLSASTTVKVDQTTSWSTTNSAAGAIGANPIVSWRMKIDQADVVGTGGAFVQELEGSFEYNEAATTFPTTQYPNGQSFTNGSVAAAALP